MKDESTAKVERESALLQTDIKTWWVYRVMGPIERLCLKSRISPNAITFGATAVTVLCFFRYATGHILSAGWLVLLVGSLDVLDGRVARASNRVTKQGAFLDSVMDRYQDFLIFAGLAVFYRHSIMLFFVLLAMGGSFFVPYVRAKSDTVGVDLAEVGTMQRPERFFLVGFGSIVSSAFQVSLMPFWEKGSAPPQHILMAVIVFLVFATNWTGFRRIQYTMRALHEGEKKP